MKPAPPVINTRLDIVTPEICCSTKPYLLAGEKSYAPPTGRRSGPMICVCCRRKAVPSICRATRQSRNGRSQLFFECRAKNFVPEFVKAPGWLQRNVNVAGLVYVGWTTQR